MDRWKDIVTASQGQSGEQCTRKSEGRLEWCACLIILLFSGSGLKLLSGTEDEARLQGMQKSTSELSTGVTRTRRLL